MHVGVGKTGSSSIQKALEAFSDINYEGKTKYPISPDSGLFSEYMYRAFESDCGKDKNAVDNVFSDEQFSEFIISGEALSHGNLLTKFKLMDYISSKFDKVEIVAYVREPNKWNAAASSQLLIDGIPITDLAKWPYVVTQYGFLEVFLEYAKSIKGIRLHIHKFEDAIKHKNGISGHFFDILQSLNLQDVPNVSNNLHENKSYDILQYIWLGHLNRLLKTEKISHQEYSDFAFLNYRTGNSNKLWSEKFFQFFCTEKALQAISYDRLMLAERFGVEYDAVCVNPQLVSESNSIMSKFSECSNVNEMIKILELHQLEVK
tara:strand:- start:69 stop:1022 length:954 start_codon:yes stop_codon:yes gene_type:complete